MLTAIRNTLPFDRRQLTTIRRRSLFVSFLCSGVAYRTYCSHSSDSGGHDALLPFAQSTTVTLLLQQHRQFPTCGQLAVFFADNGSSNASKSGQEDSKRLDKLFTLHHWVETQLPYLFNRGLFESTSEIFDPDTVLEVERSNGSVTRFSYLPRAIAPAWNDFSNETYTGEGRPRANIFLAAVRSFFAATSSQRRIDLLGVHADPKVGELEAHFRVVLLPSPTSSELMLPHDQLGLRLEKKAKWHDFRAIFCLSKSGTLTAVRLTQLTPPKKPGITLALQRLRLIRNFVPSLSGGGRRLPQPLPCISSIEATWYRRTETADFCASAEEVDCTRRLTSALPPLLGASSPLFSSSSSVLLASTRQHYPLWRLCQQQQATHNKGSERVPDPASMGRALTHHLRPLQRQWQRDRTTLLSSYPLLLASITACSHCLT